MDLAQEITSLRKSGELQAALESLPEGDKAAIDLPLKLAVGWLYYDLAKEAESGGDWEEVRLQYQLYKDLQVPLAESLIHQQFQRFEHYTSDWVKHFVLIEAQSKEGEHQEAIQACRQLAEGYPEFARSPQYGWVIWRFMKEQTEADQPNEDGINEALDLYLELDMPKPSRLHSSMLRQVIKLVGRVKFNAYKFMYHWDWQNFRPEDLERYTDEKGLHYSLLEKAMHRYAKVLTKMMWKYKKDAYIFKQLREDAQKFLPLIEGIIEERPDNPYMPKEVEELKRVMGD